LTHRGFSSRKTRKHPIGAIAELLCGSRIRRLGRRVRCAMVWAIERIEAGTLTWERIPEAIESQGGLRKVARGWLKEQRAARPASPQAKEVTTPEPGEEILSG
jgi:hypothetical protein